MLAALLWLAIAAPAAGAPEDLPLRLPDLGPGYVVNEHDCGLVLTGEEDTPPVLDRVLRPPGCFAEFTRVWRPRGSSRGARTVESLAWPFPDAAGAAAAFAEARTLTAFAAGIPRRMLTRRPQADGPGDESALFAFGRRPHAALLWRSGAVLSLVFTGARSARVAEVSARALADAQQARLAAPAPEPDHRYGESRIVERHLAIVVVRGAERRRAQPMTGLPPLILTDTHGPGGPPGLAASLEYGALTLDLWRPRAFARFARTRVGQVVRRQRCARVERISVPGGRATLVGGYASPPRRCDRRAPDVWFADVHLGDVVVSVNRPVCLLCVDGGGPYAAPAALEAVIAALRRR